MDYKVALSDELRAVNEETLVGEEVCPYCNRTDGVYEDQVKGCVRCNNCQRVLKFGVIVESAEWREFEDDQGRDDPNRVGAPESALYDGWGLSTTVGDGGGALSRVHNRLTADSSQRAILNAYNQIKDIASRMSLPSSIADDACLKFRRVHEQRPVKSKGHAATAAICLFLACRDAGVSRLLKEVSVVTGIQRAELNRAFKKVNKMKLFTRQATKQRVDPIQLLERFVSELKLEYHVVPATTHVIETAKKLRLQFEGRDPSTIAGAAILLITSIKPEDSRSVEDISRVTGVTAHTISTAFMDIFYPQRSALIPDDYAPKQKVDALQIASH